MLLKTVHFYEVWSVKVSKWQNVFYRSHDGFKEDENGYLHPAADKYADQRKVFDDLGAGVLKNAFEGKTCLKYV